jgi:hypothetical protein
VPTARVIEAVDVLEDGGFGLASGLPCAAPDQFGLNRLEEGLYSSIIVTVIRTRIPRAFLAPKVQAAILDGHQPADVSVAQLIRDDIPMDWAEQARLFGIA